jgi:hypothetical protein
MTGVPARSQVAARWCWYALLLGLAAWGAALGFNPRRAGDLRIYVTAAERFWRGLDLYRAADAAWPFMYTPAAAWLFLPLSVLPARIAAAAWNVGSIGAFGFAAARWRATLLEEPRFRSAPWAPAIATLVLAQSFFLELFHGQVNLLMLALCLWPFTAAGRRHELWSGLCLAVAVLLKPTAIVVLAAPLALRRTRILTATLVAGLAMHVPLLARFGCTGALEQLHAWAATLDRTTTEWVLGYNPQGLPTLLLSVVFPVDAQPTAMALAAANVVSLALIVGAALLLRSSAPALVALLCLGAALASPLAWRANFVLAWPVIAALLSLRTERSRRIAGVAVAPVAAVEWAVGEAALGAERARSVLALRPWGIAFLCAFGAALLLFRSTDAPARR